MGSNWTPAARHARYLQDRNTDQARQDAAFRLTVARATADLPETMDPWAMRLSYAAGDISSIMNVLSVHAGYRPADARILRGVIVSLLASDPLCRSVSDVLDAAAAARVEGAPEGAGVGMTASAGQTRQLVSLATSRQLTRG